jgi:hypothetical protein
MSSLPKRPGPYITLLLLVVMIILCVWMYQALDALQRQRAAETRTEARG